jgi:insertion element IS1 protein InsB
VSGVSERWLQSYVNQKYAKQPQVSDVPVQKKKLTLQCDELWSYVGSKAHQIWLWLALDADTWMIVGCAIGPHDKATAEDLWFCLPAEYRQRAVCFTDFYAVYATVLPSKHHKAVGKETGKTAYIERFNNTLCQRCSRLVRKTLSFSKKLANHIGAIWLFTHAYNAPICTRTAQLATTPS